MHLLNKLGCNCYHFNAMLLKTLMRMHSSHHIILYMSSYMQETPQAAALRKEEQTLEDLPECPDHRSTSFLKGKPRIVLSLLCFTKLYLSPFMFDVLGDKS